MSFVIAGTVSTERAAPCRHLQLKSWKKLWWHIIIFHAAALHPDAKIGSFCVGMRRRGRCQSGGISCPGNKTRLETLCWVTAAFGTAACIRPLVFNLTNLLFSDVATFPDHGKYNMIFTDRNTWKKIWKRNPTCNKPELSFRFRHMSKKKTWASHSA